MLRYVACKGLEMLHDSSRDPKAASHAKAFLESYGIDDKYRLQTPTTPLRTPCAPLAPTVLKRLTGYTTETFGVGRSNDVRLPPLE